MKSPLVEEHKKLTKVSEEYLLTTDFTYHELYLICLADGRYAHENPQTMTYQDYLNKFRSGNDGR